MGTMVVDGRSHREAAEAVALEREQERRGVSGSRRGGRVGGGEGGELELGVWTRDRAA
jgi:hypothetical protein